MAKQFDVVVIGAGPGGYVAAIRLAQLGKNVAIVDKRKTLGGTCLNEGCIPSKALLDSSENFYKASHEFETHGITVAQLSFDLKKMMSRKDKVVSDTIKGIDFLMKKNKITVLIGEAKFNSPFEIQVESETISAQNFIIATGSEVAGLPSLPVDRKQIITSTEALSLSSMPKKLIIVGGGVIGLEMSSIYARLGCKVMVVEFMDTLLPTMDRELSKQLQKSLEKLGIQFYLGHKVTGHTKNKSSVTITADSSSEKNITFSADLVLVAVGRRPYTANLNLDSANIALNPKGQIPVNRHFQTQTPHIYAIGDVIEGPMLAHKASEDGVAAAELICGIQAHVNYDTIPGVVYTWPEAASVGKTEDTLKSAGISYKIGKFPFKASGRARASEDTDGFVKVLADSKTDEILGVHILGARAADLIQEAVVAMEYRASAEDIGMMTHPHPTYSEAFKEAALAATQNRAIHI